MDEALEGDPTMSVIGLARVFAGGGEVERSGLTTRTDGDRSHVADR